MSEKWNLIVDVARCDNCRNCFLATKDEHIGNDFPGYAASQPEKEHSWVDIRHNERGHYPIVEANFMPVMCNHCDNAPCMKAAKNGAITKREDGIVIIDPEKSKGQKEIVDACPYGAVYWNSEKQIPQAWIFDAHLLDDGWTKPRVQQSCPTATFKSLKIEDDEMQRIKEREDLEVLLPERGTKPRVYYKNLHLMTKCFVSGSVITDVDGVEECVAGATVSVSKDGNEIGRTTTDTFGEFKIDKLAPNSGSYELQVSSNVGGNLSMEFTIADDDSPYLGVMKLG
mgnify:CR=1 FL=1